eukprot:TRINITY_DN2575_c0_g1_i1.p1 TRINITY_DN2575_c0_g1~~TRINITY_DN2575_c0_g1_i1.p1  ORF type:complete len:499 (-),score=114.06 TRINITY_DN2575_c0_g1_i1:80-1576(-)
MSTTPKSSLSSSLRHKKSTIQGQQDQLKEALENIALTIDDENERAVWEQNVSMEFQALFSQYIYTRGDTVDWSKINRPSEELVTRMKDIPDLDEDMEKDLISKLAIVKLNGGLGTSMGCIGPKSAIEVKNNQNFLDLIIKQIKNLNEKYKVSVPLLLMNSFNTDQDTSVLIERYRYSDVDIKTFNQSRFPRIHADTFLPLADHINSDDECWYPPGHGDFFRSLYNSGLLDQLEAEGKEYIFLSNVDNLAATVDLKLLAHMIERDCEYLMEVTDKTLADVKGGTIIEYEGKVKLLEIAQVPSNYVNEFKSIQKFKIFNTNNLWFSISGLKSVVEKNLLDSIEIIPNMKNVGGSKVLQLETAAGAAISFFRNAQAVNVPRTRFLPVKGTSDLFVVQSELYSTENGSLIANPQRPFPTVPIIKLGPEFKYVSDYEERIDGPIDIIELDRLTISGNVHLGRNITFKGSVIIIANSGSRIDIPDGTILENKIVSGHLEILDHS